MERSPKIRGRKSELYRIKSRIDALRNGHPGTLLIEGERGSGKSTLIESAVSRAERINLPRMASRPKEHLSVGFYV